MKYVWPIITVILLVSLVGVAAFFLGKQTANVPAPTPTLTPTITPSTNSNTNITQKLSPTPNALQTVEAGGILVFKAYSLSAPFDWVVTKEKNQYQDNVTLTKLGYKLTISQAAGGGGGCIYPGDTPSEMTQSFTEYKEIINKNGYVFRRGISSPNTWTVCQKNTSDGSFGFPTNFGNITFTTPGTPDKNAIIFPELDSILASIKTN